MQLRIADACRRVEVYEARLQGDVNRWRPSHRYDREALPLANRHYSRRSPDSPQFVRPGSNKVFVAGFDPVLALWVSVRQKHTDHAWPGTWECALFRNEGAGLSSELILEAVAATMGEWGAAPDAGFLTFIAPEHVASCNPGFCFKKAGFRSAGRTKVHKRVALVLAPEDFPEPFKVGQQGLFG